MTRLPFLLLPLVFVGAAAPVPERADNTLLYHPVKKDTTWVYTTWDSETTFAITDVEEKDGAYRVLVARKSQGKLEPDHMLTVSPQGVGIVAANVADLDEPLWQFRTPFVDGRPWDAVLAITGVGKWTGKMTPHNHEWVEVPAGKYWAVRVEMDLTFLDERRLVTTWWAPGVGKVKQVFGKEVEVLKKFVPGND